MMIERPPAYPAWPKVVAAFVAGAIFSAFCIVQVAPADRQTSTLAAGTGGDLFVTDDGTVVDDAGQVVAEDAAALDAARAAGGTSRSVVKGTAGTAGTTRRTVTGGGAAGPGGSAGTGGTAGREAGGSGAGGTTTGGTTGTGGGTSSGSGGGGAVECAAGKNGGATDVGVTATEIKLAATVVRDGPGASLLSSSEIGMKAIQNKVNAAGGICGRRLTLTLVNDSWDAAVGRDTIKRFIDEKNFALPVVPSSEGLSEAIKTGLIKDSGIPVVGANGLRIDQYSDPTTFPVGAATVSIMRAMARQAYDAGARTFGIVWDEKYKFGQEGADAFKAYVRNSLPGATVKGDQSLDPTAAGYGTPAQEFNRDCENTDASSGCDLVVLLLVPEVALKWKSANQGRFSGRGTKTYGAQTLFTDAYAKDCAGWCDGMSVWTGYNPAIPPLDSLAGVGAYVNDVRGLSPSVDYRNQFLQGAYLGMQVFVDAVKACSPNLTRACVNTRLDSVAFETDLASRLEWAPGKHHANKKAQRFTIDAAGGSFNSWQHEPQGFIQDPSL